MTMLASTPTVHAPRHRATPVVDDEVTDYEALSAGDVTHGEPFVSVLPHRVSLLDRLLATIGNDVADGRYSRHSVPRDA